MKSVRMIFIVVLPDVVVGGGVGYVIFFNAGLIVDFGGWIELSVIANFDNINRFLSWIAILSPCIFILMNVFENLSDSNCKKMTGLFFYKLILRLLILSAICSIEYISINFWISTNYLVFNFL